MKVLALTAFSISLIISSFVACTTAPSLQIPPVAGQTVSPVKKTMQSFSTDQELLKYLKKIAEKQKSARRREAAGLSTNSMPAEAPVSVAKEVAKSGDDKDAESVTNVQHAGVDEGGIVKVHGDHLVVLRRGRLFTVAIADGALKPVSVVDAYGPDMNPSATWYDEMLVSSDTVVVIGYSYERGGTEVGLFKIDDAGKLSYRSTYHLRSNDYYSSRNYASRLIGNKLIFYTPLELYPGQDDPFETFPAVRKWHRDAKPTEFQRIASANHVYRPSADFGSYYDLALHTVTTCDLSNEGFNCDATSVIGPSGRVFYVSPQAVYVWASSWYPYDEKEQRAGSLLFRMPLDGSGPSALGVSGSPVDQFSFLESDDQHLNVLVRSEAKGDGMWAAETAAGDVALMRLPIMSFSDGSEKVPASNYRRLPKPLGYTFQNRFVADYLIYGTGSGWGSPGDKDSSSLFLVRWARGDSHQLSLPHGVDRIEQMGSDAVIVGTDGTNLHFSSVKLGSWPEVVSRYTRKDASQGELRSHGFFYKPDGDNTGTLGLPISVPARAGYRHLFEDSAAILFLRNDSLTFREVGELNARQESAVNDSCKASCVDWYGNARPLFLRGRVFALLGYELVEGRIDDGRMHEIRRVSYAPGRQQITRNQE